MFILYTPTTKCQLCDLPDHSTSECDRLNTIAMLIEGKQTFSSQTRKQHRLPNWVCQVCNRTRHPAVTSDAGRAAIRTTDIGGSQPTGRGRMEIVLMYSAVFFFITLIRSVYRI